MAVFLVEILLYFVKGKIMATYSTSEFKSGLKIMIDGDPCAIIDNEFVKPGKGQAFNRVKYRNLKTGRVIEKTYKSVYWKNQSQFPTATKCIRITSN